MANQPTAEQRIKAAMALANIDFPELAERIATKNYGARTLRKIADPNDPSRTARPPDLYVIGKACGVSAAFWSIDFRELEDPLSLHEHVDRLSEGLASLSAEVAQNTRRLRAHLDTDHRQRPQAGDG